MELICSNSTNHVQHYDVTNVKVIEVVLPEYVQWVEEKQGKLQDAGTPIWRSVGSVIDSTSAVAS